MSLSIELYHQLYKAGFPQEPCERFWIAVDRGTALGNVYDRTHQPVACECPNSDELIAQIQAEWLDIEYLCDNPDTERNTWEIDYTVDVDDDWHLAEGATLAESLANLYIALMKESA